MGRRSYSGAAAQTTLAVVMDTVVLSATVAAFVDWPTGSGGPFAMTLDRGLATEEKVLVDSITGSVATLLQRGYDGTTAHSHTVGTTVEHTVTGIDLDEANAHVNATGSTHGLGPTEGAFVGTSKTQTLTGKSIDGVSNTLTNIPRTASPELQADIAAEAASRAAGDTARYTKSEVDALLLALTPPGTIIMHGGASAPTGYLSCNGTAVSRTTYAALFAAIGTTHGVGDGSTTFNLPDLSAKNPRGAGGGYTAGQAGGSETHVLVEANLPPHAHTINHTHTTPSTASGNESAGHTHDRGAHSHTIASLNLLKGPYTAPGTTATSDNGAGSVAGGPTSGRFVGAETITGSTTASGTGATGSSSASHTHTTPAMTTDSQSTPNSGNGAGTSTPVNALDPYTIVLFCIKV